MDYNPRSSRPPRSRGRGGFRGRGRSSSNHFNSSRGTRGRGRGFPTSHVSRSPPRNYPAPHSSRASYSQHPSSTAKRYAEQPTEKYPSYRSSSREDYRPKYPRTESPDYYQSSSYRSEIPRKKSHSNYVFEGEIGSSRNSSRFSGSSSYLGTEERYERREYTQPSRQSPPERYPSSSRDVYRDEAPPAPLLSQEYAPAPKPLIPYRGRGAPRGRGYVSRGVSRGGVIKKRATLATQKKLLFEKIKRSKMNTMKLLMAKDELEPSPDSAEFSGASVSHSDEEDLKDSVKAELAAEAIARKKLIYERRTRTGRKFIRLNCPHCKEACTTFRQYEMHLLKKRHTMAMTKVSLRSKQQVMKMRAIQRKLQNEEEEKANPEEPLTSFTKFCPICKLNYRQSKLIHNKSKEHIEMKNFLFPTCKVCSIPFKSVRLYEQHICSLDHIKAAAYLNDQEDKDEDDDDEGEIDEEALNCLEGFMVVDSVGDEDDEDSIEKEEVLPGVDKIKTVEAQFCELCQRFLPRLDDSHKARAIHCRSYLHKKNLAFEQKRTAQNNTVKREPEAEATPNNDNDEEQQEEVKAEDAEETKTNEESTRTEEADDDEVLWRDVDNDIGELLKDRTDENSANSNDIA